MQLSDFNYDLPAELIPQAPVAHRSASRLLVLTQDGDCCDRSFSEIADLLHPGDLLVVNDTKVIKARLHGQKSTGGKVEVMLERVTDEFRFLAQVKASKSPKPGQLLNIDGANEPLLVLGRVGAFFELELQPLAETNLTDWFNTHGALPLPPYVSRPANEQDESRYQTVYALNDGAVAAPTAGLHYTPELMDTLQKKGVRIARVTLHVGAGTYQPVRVDSITDHTMHSEWVQVDQTVCDAVNQTKAAGGRVVAVGTTTIRSLESAARASRAGHLQPFTGETDIFIYPGYQFQVVDCLQTNFHLPESTLMMLVSAFVDRDSIMRAYEHAIAQKYRFFSYGDAMFLYCKNKAKS